MKTHHTVSICVQVSGKESYIQCHLKTILLMFFIKQNISHELAC